MSIQARLARINKREAQLRALVDEPDRRARLHREAAAVQDDAPLRGWFLGVKDILHADGLVTRAGTSLPPDLFARDREAACVAALRRTGCLVIGKTVTTEFAMFAPGRTANPHDTAHTPGGSSSGSAAAVADGMVPLALGTQTAGSIIRPASFCGVVGYKPTFDSICPTGLKNAAWTLDTVGVFARDVADAALFAGVLDGRRCRADAFDASRPPRLGLCRTPQWAAADADTRAAMAEAERQAVAAGATVRPIDLPAAFDALLAAQHTIMAYELARTLAFEYDTAASQISDRLRAILDEGQMIDGAAYDAARRVADECRSGLDAVFANAGVDVLIAPSAPGEAPLRRQGTGDPVFNRIWTLLGVPCINVPGLTGATGLPVGVQVVGKCNDDATALAAARWLATSIQAPTRD